jgi:hypothetical protein
MNSLLKMYKIYELVPTNDSSRQLILEPLSCVLKLSLLQWKPAGTKVSVYNNSLLFNEPSLIQGVTRRITGDSRQDLHNICHPIIKCLEWYPLNDPVNAFFYDECIKGLHHLKSSYNSNSIINHTLDHYTSLLSGKENSEDLEDTAVTTGLRDKWMPSEITIAKTMLEHIITLDDKETYITLFEQLLTNKEQEVNNYIKTISTSY